MARIHIIDDDELLREAIASVLSEAGYMVDASPNGRSGLTAVRQQLPDLILCDIAMPEVSGFEVLQQLRMDPATVDIPFIYLTGRLEREDRRRGMDLGADDFITKPFSQSELLSAIQSRIAKRAREVVKHETTISKLRNNIIYALPHELRTPLVSILGYSEYMKDNASDLGIADVEQMSASILTAGMRLNRLIENYLVFAQLEMVASDPSSVGKLRNNVMRDAAQTLGLVAQEVAGSYGRGDDLELDLAKSAIRMSEQNFQKVGEELIDNAFKFSKAGSKVLIKSARKDGSYRVFIRDRGRGMTTDQVSSIGAYMQFDRALHEQQGLGLGFFLAKRIIDLHGGDFEVRSEPNNGTGILFTVPD